jgi:hypothetical protein
MDINAMIEMVRVHPPDIVEQITVESEVVLARVNVNPIPAVLIGNVPVSDVSHFIPPDRNIVRAVVAVNAFVASALNHKALNDDVRGAVQVEISGGAVAAGPGRRIPRIQNGSTAILRFERDRIAGRARVGQIDDITRGSDELIVVRPVHHDNGIAWLSRG